MFEQRRQINSQLTQEPTWGSDGSTGEIKKEIDVSGLTKDVATQVTLRATSVNIGDGELPTSVSATLEAIEPLQIQSAVASGREFKANNDGTFYSVPRPVTTNELQRTFTVELSKPSGSTLTAVSVDLLDGSESTLMTVLQKAAPGASGVEVLNETDTTVKLKVRVTVSSPASSVAGSPPPTRDLRYRIKVEANDADGRPLSDEKTVGPKRSLWRMPDGQPRYGQRDHGGDNWVSRGAYQWIVANAAKLREIDDVSGEHGRNIGHSSHARGTDIDMYHFYRFAGATTGGDNHSRLRSEVIAAFGSLEAKPTAGAMALYDRVSAWLAATRQGLASLTSMPSVELVIYCEGASGQGLPAGWCATLVQTGQVARTVSGSTQSLTFGSGFTHKKMRWKDDHNDHIHITLDPTQLGE